MYFGGERYVDLGLGSHRVKCRVHRDFRCVFETLQEAKMIILSFPSAVIFVTCIHASYVMVFWFLRLIVVAEKNVVYKRFPIPLINRLEKHFLNISTLLSPLQLKLTRLLDEWADEFISPLNCENEE